LFLCTVLEYCEKQKIGFEVALAWLLSRSPVMLPIPGTSRIEHLEENVATAALQLDAKQMQELPLATGG
jgi:pyridoxine 4-dehydrogenase